MKSPFTLLIVGIVVLVAVFIYMYMKSPKYTMLQRYNAQLKAHPTDCGGGRTKCTLDRDCGEYGTCDKSQNIQGWGCCAPKPWWQR